jgi:hypothetical protein
MTLRVLKKKFCSPGLQEQWLSSTLGGELFSTQAVGTCWNHSNVVPPVVTINRTVNSETRFDELNMQHNASPHKTTLAVYMGIIV